MNCPICRLPVRLAGQSTYYDCDRGATFPTSFYYCEPCDLYVRDVTEQQCLGHLGAASYVQLANERRFLSQRQKFFRRILDSLPRYLRRSPAHLRLIDFGSAYGHLIDLARARNVEAVGVEINPRLADHCAKRGLRVVRDLENVPWRADVITLIDSLYYTRTPVQLLTQLRNRLASGGILFIRLTNRNWLARSPFGDLDVLGDCTISYSPKAIRGLAKEAGFRIRALAPESGAGKDVGLRRTLFYRGTYLLSVLTGGRFILTPGMIAVLEDPASPITEKRN